MNAALEKQNDRLRADPASDFDTFAITINGTTLNFLLGGPQCAALYEFVLHVCSENGYALDWLTGAVTEG